MIQLTDEQVRALQRVGEATPTVVDPTTNTAYVLVRKDLYERLQDLLDDDLPDVSSLAEEAMREEDAGDPTLESYQRYRHGPAR